MSIRGPIVLIDDDPDEIELLKAALKKLSLPNPVISFKNGREALEYLLTTPDNPLIILSDLSMPVMNGMELRKAINKHPELKKKAIPFVFRSGSLTLENVNEAYELSVQGFFPKVADYDELVAQVKLIFDYWRQCYQPNSPL